jgi:hypothetical protein
MPAAAAGAVLIGTAAACRATIRVDARQQTAGALRVPARQRMKGTRPTKAAIMRLTASRPRRRQQLSEGKKRHMLRSWRLTI